MLVKVSDLLKDATQNKYGVPAINVINVATAHYAVMAAEREKMPIIVQYWPGFKDYVPLKTIASAAKQFAEEASVPVAVHQDHSWTYDIAVEGIRDGFSSVMVDGSSLPYEENVALTKSVVDVANVFGVDIEAELGHVGDGSKEEDFATSDFYTNPAQAAEFVERTGCGSLAIAVGNAHGPYVKVPKLDFDRIRECREAVDVPLVMHGGSDIPDEQLQKAVNLGMSKFNIATEYFRAMYRDFERQIAAGDVKDNGVALLMGVQDACVDFVASKIRLLNPNNYSM
jgi:ketose-bisphosphate aldolase